MNNKDKNKQTDNMDDFTQEMMNLGVKPLSKKQDKVPEKPLPNKPKIKKNNRPYDIEEDSPGGPDYLRRQATGKTIRHKAVSDSLSQWLGPHDIVEFQRSGVQHKQFKDLKKGKIRPENKVDLHGHTVEEARQLLIDFLAECREHNERCVLVVHGKGFHTRPKEAGLYEKDAIAKIKSYTVHWLKQMDEVIALSSSQPKDGGTGALYVLLSNLSNKQ